MESLRIGPPMAFLPQRLPVEEVSSVNQKSLDHSEQFFWRTSGWTRNGCNFCRLNTKHPVFYADENNSNLLYILIVFINYRLSEDCMIQGTET